MKTESKDVPWRINCRRVAERVYSVFCFEGELVMEQSNLGWNQRLGDNSCEASIQILKKGRKDVERLLCEDGEGGKVFLEKG